MLDFGISQASWRPRLTEGERVAGTPQYMAPEQACGLREQIDHRSDQFSLAAIAYTLLTGQEPFRGENPIAVLYEVVHHDPHAAVGGRARARPGDRRGDHARAGQGSADRYADVLAFASALRGAIQGTTPAPFVDPISEPPPVRVSAALVAPRPCAWSRFGAAGRAAAANQPIDVDVEAPRGIARARHRAADSPHALAGEQGAAADGAAGPGGGGGFAWFSPATRGPTRAAWHRAGAQMHIMIERVLPNRDLRP